MKEDYFPIGDKKIIIKYLKDQTGVRASVEAALFTKLIIKNKSMQIKLLHAFIFDKKP